MRTRKNAPIQRILIYLWSLLHLLYVISVAMLAFRERSNFIVFFGSRGIPYGDAYTV